MCGVAVQSIHQAAKKGGFCNELLSQNDFEAILAAFSCYEYGTNTSEADQKITADQKQYFLVCYNLLNLNSQNIPTINNSEKRLVTRTPKT